MVLTTVLEIALGIIGLSIVVLVHEAGHYAAARMTGIGVETFSVGFGRKLLGFHRGDTEYRISIIPLGGYCRFYGEQSFRKALDEGLEEIPRKRGEFYGAEAWKRIIVAISGPLANVLFSIIVLTGISWIGYNEKYSEPRIILVSEYSQDGDTWPADDAGLKSGDRIVAIDGEEIDRFFDVRRELIFRPQEDIALRVDRDGRVFETVITPRLDKESGRALIGVLNWVDPVIDYVQAESPAYFAGLNSGDRIVEIDGRAVAHSVDVFNALETGSKQVELHYLRNGERYSTLCVLNDDKILGVDFQLMSGRSAELGFFASLAKGASDTGTTLVSTIKGLRVMFMGIELHNAVSGPIRLISDTGATVAAGFQKGLGPGLLWSFELMALISVSLAFLNLLPIPVLDGGQIILFAIEWLRRKPFRPRSVYRYQFVGTIIVFIIALAATTGDLIHFRGR